MPRSSEDCSLAEEERSSSSLDEAWITWFHRRYCQASLVSPGPPGSPGNATHGE